MSEPKTPWEVKDNPDALLELMRDYSLEMFEPGTTELSEHGIDGQELSQGMAYMFARLDKLMEEGSVPKRWKQDGR
jgi:hypothetical protein